MLSLRIRTKQATDQNNSMQSITLRQLLNGTVGSWIFICWHHRIFFHKLSAMLAAKSFLEFVGDECDNLNFINFKTDSFKIHKNSWILGNFKIRKIRIINVWLVHCVQTAEDIVKLLCRPSSSINLVFWHPAQVQNSKGNPFSGGAKFKGRENFAIFDGNRRLSRKRYEIGPCLVWNVNRKSLCALSNGDIFNDLDRPLTRFQGHGTFEVEYLLGTKIPYYRTLIGNYT